MTQPPPPKLPPWYRPTSIQPTVQPRRRLPSGVLVALAVLVIAGLCAGGVTVLGSVFGGHGSERVAAAPVPAASSSAAAEPTPVEPESGPATPLTTPPTTKPATKKPKPRAATTKPKPRPTTPKPQPRPTASPKPAPATPGPPQTRVRLGSFCSPEGAVGVTSRNRPARCTREPDEARPRWRRAF